ncbi:MAG: hypothetical protein JWN29_2639 [Acidimicrobiales bacterium]|jgi:hypothetical protein|nr:hypothetical protein [Acidimicrobiales bacterium]
MRTAAFLPLVRSGVEPHDQVVRTPTDTAHLADLINELNRRIDDGYEGVALPTDSPVFLLRQLAHARRRLN